MCEVSRVAAHCHPLFLFPSPDKADGRSGRKEVLPSVGCLFDLLKCCCEEDCGRKYMLMKLICAVSWNRSDPAHEYPDCREGAGGDSLLVSPLVVAGIVIGLVLFLSCITIVVGSLRKDGRLRSHHFHPRDGPDGVSYGGSVGELRSACVEDFPPAFDFGLYAESPAHGGFVYQDAPPQ
ncbi:uncharacterized protein LOC108926225 [Arapaima gigas]